MNTLNALNTITACEYKLPCGICEKLKAQCPKQMTVNYCNGDQWSNSAQAYSNESLSVHKEGDNG